MQNENRHGQRMIFHLALAAGIGLLCLQVYIYLIPLLLHHLATDSLSPLHKGPTADIHQIFPRIGQRLLDQTAATGIFRHWWNIRLLALIALCIFLSGFQLPKAPHANWRTAAAITAPGLLLYALPPPLVSFPNPFYTPWFIVFLLTTMLGTLLFLRGAILFSRIIYASLGDKDPFGRRSGGFPQQEQKIDGDYGLSLPAIYRWQGKERHSWINIINPRRGVLILGSPGSGKSWFIIEPLLRQLISRGSSIFLFDFKYPQLSRLAHSLFQANRDKYLQNAGFYYINFTNVEASHRCNVIAPATLPYLSDAVGISRTILLSMNKTWVHRQGEFFVESPVNFLAAIIWFLRKWEDGRYCTLPHAIELAQQPYEDLFSALSFEPEVQALIRPFIDAWQNQAMEMLEGQTASARIPLARLASPELYYILTGDDCTLEINDPAAPAILCLGGDPPRQEALGPILSLYIDRLNRLVNRPDRHPCALVCDEFATVRAYSMISTIATARSNNIIPILAVQDLSQLRTQYSRDEADGILNICGNLFCGQAAGETARWISERFPRILREHSSISTNSNDTSVNLSRQWEPTITQATIANLSSGEFLGLVTDDPGSPLELKTFHARIIREENSKEEPADLPALRTLTSKEIQEHYQQIHMEAKMIIEDVLRIVDSTNSLKKLRLKRKN